MEEPKTDSSVNVVEVRFGRRYPSAPVAERIARALAADQPGHVETVRDGDHLSFRVAPANAASVRATLEDLLACLQTAEKSAQ